MANLLSSSEISNITGAFGDVIDTFKVKMVIFKEPKKVVSDVNTSFLFGYAEESKETNYSYSAVSGIYSGIVMRRPQVSDAVIEEANIDFPHNKVLIKVEEDARNYINRGKTEKILIDDKNFNVVSSDKLVRFLTKKYYIFELEDAV